MLLQFIHIVLYFLIYSPNKLAIDIMEINKNIPGNFLNEEEGETK